MLLNNCFTIYHGNLAEGSAHGLLPGQWNSYRQHEKGLTHEYGDTAVRQTTANPPGHYLPLVYHPPMIAGDMALRTLAEGGLAADLIPTYPMSIDLTGAGDLTATGGLVVAMLLALAGSGSLTAAITGRLNATIDMTGSGDLDADMQGIASMVAELLGAGDLDATIAAFGDMAIDIVVTGTGLSTANVGQAVWSALQAAINNPGTAGAALLAAGSAGDPWSTALPGSYPAGSAGALLSALYAGLTPEQQARLLDVWQRLGLDPANPQVTTATSIEAGGVSQTIAETAGPTITVTRAP